MKVISIMYIEDETMLDSLTNEPDVLSDEDQYYLCSDEKFAKLNQIYHFENSEIGDIIIEELSTFLGEISGDNEIGFDIFDCDIRVRISDFASIVANNHKTLDSIDSNNWRESLNKEMIDCALNSAKNTMLNKIEELENNEGWEIR